MDDDCYDKNVLVIILFKLAPKIQDSQIYQYYDIISFSPKTGKGQYRKDQKDRKNRKDKGIGENKMSKRDRKSYWGNKLDPLIRENNGSETSVHYHKT